MELDRIATLTTAGLAACLVLFGVLALASSGDGLAASVPDAVVAFTVGAVPLLLLWGLSVLPGVDGVLSSLPVLTLLPLLLALGVVGRAVVTRSPTDAVLAAFATPCLLVTGWSLYSYYVATPGVYFGGVLSLFAGALLAALVLADSVTRVRLPTS
jgi:hypothetical protein